MKTRSTWYIMKAIRGMLYMEEKELWQLDGFPEVQEEIQDELDTGDQKRVDKLLFIGQRNLHKEIKQQEKRIAAIVTLVTVLSSALSVAVAV